MIPLRDDIKSRRWPLVTVVFIVANCAVFVYEIGLGGGLRDFIRAFGFTPVLLTGGDTFPRAALTLFTSMFIHANFWHIGGNMLFLWVFGDNVEDVFGRIGFVLFYAVSGLGGSLLHFLMSRGSSIPSVGASGAISGVMGAYLLLYPRARILALIPFGFFLRASYIPALFFLGFWFVLQLLYGLASRGGGAGVAYFAHIGGFAAGVLMALPFKFSRRRVFSVRE